MGDFKRMTVWNAAHALAVRVYALTHSFPRDEVYGLTSQIRRSAASVPANIAESTGRVSEPDQSRLLQVALSSARELEAHLLLARDLGYLSAADCVVAQSEVDTLQRRLVTLLRYKSRVWRPKSHVAGLKSRTPRPKSHVPSPK